MVERVDGLHAQPRGIAQQLPAARSIALRYRLQQRRFDAGNEHAGLGGLQRLENAMVHLGRRLTREGDRQNLLGRIDHRKQRQESRGQHGGLARTRRRLQQQRTMDVERLAAGVTVQFQRLECTHDDASCGNASGAVGTSAVCTRHSSCRWQ